MKVRTSLALGVVLVVLACEGGRQLTAPGSPNDPSKIILDGNHGGNKDFFFMPPMVPLPVNNPDFELGKFNNDLRPSLRIEICELNADHLKTGGLPTDQTTCGAIKKTFAPGSVQLVNLPLKQNGWWSLLNLPPDGFYYALWDTRQSNLSVSKYYRIKVFVDGKPDPLGVADVDPMANLFQWKYSLTGEVIQLVDDVMLPITFRVERGALCEGGACNSVTITNNSPTGVQNVTVDGGGGSIAGASFPNGWLPPGGPQSVVVTISEVTSSGGGNASGDGTACHVGLALQQFRGCFNYTTTPALQPINERGDEFALPVTVAVCYELDGTGDPREKFAELWASGPNEPPHPLDDASDAGLLGATSRNCSRPPVIGQLNSNPVLQLAAASWQKIKTGFGRAFGVKTAYAVDLGLGGFAFAFSHVSPVLSASIQPYTATSLTNLGPGATTTATARIVGNNHHSSHTLATGLGGLPVTYTLAEGNGSLLPLGGEGSGSSTVTVTTNTNPIDGSPTSGGGFAPVNWTMPTPTTPGTYTYALTATGPALGGPVTFTSTVTVGPTLPDLVVSAGPTGWTPNLTSTAGGLITFGPTTLRNLGGNFSGAANLHFGFYVSTDPIITVNDIGIFGGNLGGFEGTLGTAGGSATIPNIGGPMPRLAPGTYYVGLIIDDANAVAEGDNETNNFSSTPLIVEPTIEFETLPNGSPACDGAGSCAISQQFANQGVQFTFLSSAGSVFAPSFCQTLNGPRGEGSNYGVSPPVSSLDGRCTGWQNGTVTMIFTSHPTTVQVQIEGRQSEQPQFLISASDVNGNGVPRTRQSSMSYLDRNGDQFRREVWQVTSPNGISTVSVPSEFGIHVIDDLIIKQ